MQLLKNGLIVQKSVLGLRIQFMLRALEMYLKSMEINGELVLLQ